MKINKLILKSTLDGYVKDILRIRSNEVISQLVIKISPKNNQIVYVGISLKERPNLIGTICLWDFSEVFKTAEVGYELLPEYHRQGIMSEALKAILDFCFNKLNIR